MGAVFPLGPLRVSGGLDEMLEGPVDTKEAPIRVHPSLTESTGRDLREAQTRLSVDQEAP